MVTPGTCLGGLPPEAVAGYEDRLQARHPLEICVAGHDREIALKGGRGDQRVDVTDEAWPVWLA